MKKYRTPQSKRANYAYYDNSDRKLAVLRPGKDGVTAAHIAVLHGLDDEECRQQHQDTRNDGKFKTEATASLEELDADGVWIAGNTPDPLENCIRTETQDLVRKAVSELPQAQSEAVTAVWFDGMTARQYAKAAGKTESAVSQLLDRAFKNLRGKLSR